MNARQPRHAVPRAPIAPLHRGPQALPPSVATATYGAPMQHAPNAALLIDFDNVTMGIRSDLAAELRSLLSSDIIKGKVAVQRAYADWRRYPQYIVPLAESSIDMIMAPAYGSSKKNATDIRLAVDAIELVFTRPEIGTYILLSGDSDFASMVTKLKEYGKYVIGVGIRESSSDLLVMNCDEYYSYTALAGLVKQSEEDVQKWDPWELVVEAIGRMKKNGDVMRSDRLKQVMQDIDATFDEKNYGYSKFSKFVSDAAEKGLVGITKLENGQLEVGPSGSVSAGTGDGARRPAPTGDDDAPREERSGRRGRRGGRGRGRDRDDRGERGVVSAAAPTDEDSITTDTESAALDLGPAPLPAEPPARSEHRSAHREARSESRAESRPESRTESRPEPRSESRPEPRSEPRTNSRQDSRQDSRADARSDARSDTRAEVRAEPRAESRDDVGRSGERLTRQEAFDLVRRATTALVSGDVAASARAVRAKAFDLLGRDSESLSERNFERILKDAHDQEVIDLRRRAGDFEVALPAEVAPVAEQLNRAAAAHTASVAAATPAMPPVPRGMVPRGAPPRGGRGPTRSSLGPPPELLMVGVVDDVPTSPAIVAAPQPVAAADIPDVGVPKARAPRGRSKPKVNAADAAETADAAAPKAAARRAPAAKVISPKTPSPKAQAKPPTAKAAKGAPAATEAKGKDASPPAAVRGAARGGRGGTGKKPVAL